MVIVVAAAAAAAAAWRLTRLCLTEPRSRPCRRRLHQPATATAPVSSLLATDWSCATAAPAPVLASLAPRLNTRHGRCARRPLPHRCPARSRRPVVAAGGGGCGRQGRAVHCVAAGTVPPPVDASLHTHTHIHIHARTHTQGRTTEVLRSSLPNNVGEGLPTVANTAVHSGTAHTHGSVTPNESSTCGNNTLLHCFAARTLHHLCLQIHGRRLVASDE